MKLAIINRGVVATGKSSFIKEIKSSLTKNSYSCEICSTDDFFMKDGEYKFEANKLQENHLKNQDKFFNTLKQGIDLVICDNTNLSPWEAKPYYNMAKQFEYKVIILDFAPRNIDDILDSQIHNVPKEIIVNMLQRYNQSKLEEFSCDEVIQILPDEFNQTKNIIGDLIVKKIKTYLPNEIEIIPKEYRTIIKELHKKRVISAYDIAPMLDKSVKQTERYFNELKNEFKNIIQIKQGKRKAYKLIDNFDIFIEVFKKIEKIEELEELLYISQKSNPELFKKLDYNLNNDDIFMFRGAIFESVENKKIFNNLKSAIKYSEYRIIKFRDENEKEIKPIKLVFIDNNWYLAYVENDILKLGRISFIENLKYSDKNSFQKLSIKKHLNKLSKIQNSMTLFDKPTQIAKIKATPNVSKYFKKGMKKFLSSQQFIEELEDGSVIFSIEYTQPIEILPFIQKWLPDLIILSPDELKKEYLEKLTQTIQNQN